VTSIGSVVSSSAYVYGGGGGGGGDDDDDAFLLPSEFMKINYSRVIERNLTVYYELSERSNNAIN